MSKLISKLDSAGKKHYFPICKPIYKLEGHFKGNGSHSYGSKRKNGRLHAGIDLYAPRGSEVYSIQDGIVSRIALFYEGSFAVEIKHASCVFRYCEIAPVIGLQIGSKVSAGDVIGHITTLNSTSLTMLHLEQYHDVNASGALTQIGTNRYQRRADLINPEKYLLWLIS
jgi:murein DD-endopeptidase MepM/ murein hydrolase activator NlpD